MGEIDSNVLKRFQQPPDLFQPFRKRTRWHLTITIWLSPSTFHESSGRESATLQDGCKLTPRANLSESISNSFPFVTTAHCFTSQQGVSSGRNQDVSDNTTTHMAVVSVVFVGWNRTLGWVVQGSPQPCASNVGPVYHGIVPRWESVSFKRSSRPLIHSRNSWVISKYQCLLGLYMRKWPLAAVERTQCFPWLNMFLFKWLKTH